MLPSAEGLVPASGVIEPYLETLSGVPEWEIHRLEPLLDSANMRPGDWVRIAEEIEVLYEQFDGFVVLHGTDTMVYSASAVSFLLHGLTKPVIFTGAQLPLWDVRSDGRQHLITAMLLAEMPIPEVGLYFAQRLLRGNRAQKVHNHDFVAFASGNLRPLAHVGVKFDLRHDIIRPKGRGILRHVGLERSPQVVALRVFPGIAPDLLRRVMAEPVDGVILETYGTGTFPSANPELLEVIEAAILRGVVVINCSQCHSGRVNQGLYGTGRALADVGVISGHDMTPEAALTKLYCLLGAGRSIAVVRAKMEEDLAGEISPIFGFDGLPSNSRAAEASTS